MLIYFEVLILASWKYISEQLNVSTYWEFGDYSTNLPLEYIVL